MKALGMFIGGITFAGVVTYGMYWVTKTFSYWLFYEDMVKSTVGEVLRSQGLI